MNDITNIISRKIVQRNIIVQQLILNLNTKHVYQIHTKRNCTIKIIEYNSYSIVELLTTQNTN